VNAPVLPIRQVSSYAKAPVADGEGAVMADLGSTGDQSAQAFRDFLTMLSAATGLAVVMGLLIVALAMVFA
jgi:hypothetical protein